MPSTLLSPYLLPIVLLIGSNVFMTLAWYGHLRFKETPLIGVIVASWGIAFVEYCMAVPANRWGSAVYSTAQLKTIQEIVTLLVFAAFSVLYLKEPMTWNYAIGFALVAAGGYFIFVDRCEIGGSCRFVHTLQEFNESIGSLSTPARAMVGKGTASRVDANRVNASRADDDACLLIPK